MKTDVRVSEEIRIERRKLFWRLYSLPVIILSLFCIASLICNVYFFNRINSLNTSFNRAPIKREIIVSQDIGERNEQKILERIKELDMGDFEIISSGEKINNLIWEKELPEDNLRLCFVLFNNTKLVPESGKREYKELKRYDEELKKIYEEVGIEEFSELILKYRIKEREYTFSINDWLLAEGLNIPLEENLIGYNRILIQKELEKLRLDGLNISIKEENLIKDISQKSIEKVFDGFETYRKIYKEKF